MLRILPLQFIGSLAALGGYRILTDRPSGVLLRALSGNRNLVKQAVTLQTGLETESWISFLLDRGVSQAFSCRVRCIADGAQDSVGRSLNIVTVNIKGGPIADRAISPRCNRENPYRGMFTQNEVTDGRAILRLIQSDYQQVRECRLHLWKNLRFVGYLPDNFDAGLIAQSRQNYFPHQFGAVCHQNPRRLFHELCLAG